jgi:hypothetical protein
MGVADVPHLWGVAGVGDDTKLHAATRQKALNLERQ